MRIFPAVEFRTEAIEAWRAWRLCRGADGQLALVSSSLRAEWPARDAPPAVCDPVLVLDEPAPHHRGLVPEATCTCGYYALARPGALLRFGEYVAVVGQVAMWGRVVEHWTGYRSRFAYPQRLRLVCGKCLGLGRRGRPTVAVTRPDGEVRAACRRHVTGLPIGGAVERAAEVEAELLDRYAVELLPLESLPCFSRRQRAVRALEALKRLPRPEHPVRLVLSLLLILWIGRALLSGGGEEPDPYVGPRVDAAAAPVTVPAQVGLGLGLGPREPATLRLTFRCGVTTASGIRIARCDAPNAVWISGGTYVNGTRPECSRSEVVQRLPNGRSRCWFRLDR